MPLTNGSRLGPYEIGGLLGSGGMGDVYRARDTRLDRDVAVKVLAPHVASDADARARFDREARSVSQLQHPNICALFDVGREAETDYLVLEYLQGETLADRLAALGGKALPLAEALAIAVQVAEALDHAHRHGLVHRDLKPGNVMLVRRQGAVAVEAKLLDFGLAKDGAARAALEGAASIVTKSVAPLTGKGTILGTLQYMAPEQLEGRDADARTDIFAFGALVYELITGRRAFEAKSQVSLIAAILEHDPPPMTPSDLGSAIVPASLDRIVRTCLAKDPDQRWQSAGDLARQLRWVNEVAEPDAGAVAVRRRLPIWVGVVGALAAAALGVAAGLVLRRPAPQAPLSKLRVDVLLSSGRVNTVASLSPDGRWLAHRGRERDQNLVVSLRDLATGEDRVVQRNQAWSQPAWSPSGKTMIWASANGGLRVVDVASASVRVIQSGGTKIGLNWIDEQEIIYGDESGVYRLRVDGGTPQTLPAPAGELRWMPAVLPDGRRYLFLKQGDGPEYDLCVGSLDAEPSTCLTRAAGFAYGRGRLLLTTTGDGRLRAQRLDPDSPSLLGDPVELSATVSPSFYFGFFASPPAASVSRDGLIAFVPTAGQEDQSNLVWFDRAGRRQQEAIDPLPGAGLELSHDGRYGVTAVTGGPIAGLYVLDFQRRVRTRLMSRTASDPQLSPDGRLAAYTAQGRIYVRGTFGGDPRPVFAPENAAAPLEDWSDDGKYLIAGVITGNARSAVRVSVDGREPPLTLVKNLAGLDEMRLSPDGKWLAYNASDSGRDEVYVSPVPPTGERFQVSAAGGMSARWQDDGTELFYLRPDGTLMAVGIRVREGRFDPLAAAPLFKTPITPTYNLDHFVVGPGGRTFLLRLPMISTEPATATLLVNWIPDEPSR